MKYQILYHPLVVREDIPRLDLEVRKRIKKAIEQKLMIRPEIFGLPLKSPLKNYRKLRVGNWRIIFKIEKNKIIIIFIIQHRSRVYKNINARI